MIKELGYTKDFGERLKQKRDRTGFPRGVLFEITHRCNLRCRHCYVVPESKKRELTTFEIKSIFDQLVEAGCLHVTLTGGEPLMREDIFSLIDYARRIGLFIHLFTNATLITPRIADRLREFQLISLEVSFHSLKKERFDWFTQVDGSFDNTMKAINLLREKNIKLFLKINLTKLNIDEIQDLKRFVDDLEAVPEWATILSPKSDGSKDNLVLRLEPEEVLKVNEIIYPESVSTTEGRTIDKGDSLLGEIQEDEVLGRDWAMGKLFRCGGGISGLAINPYGELKPCVESNLPGFSILNNSLKVAQKLQGDYMESFKISPDSKCIECKLSNFCLSCPVKASLECGDMNSCPDYHRRLAQLYAQKHEHTKSGI